MTKKLYSPLDYSIHMQRSQADDDSSGHLDTTPTDTPKLSSERETHPSYGATNGGTNGSSSPSKVPLKSPTVDGKRFWSKVHTSFYEDAKNFEDGTIPQSIMVAVVIGVVCGVSAYVYYQILFAALDYFWKTLPQKTIPNIFGSWGADYQVLWIPIAGFSMAILVGLSVIYLGEPGDLAYTVKCVHEKAYIKMDHVLPMVMASQFSILGGASLGPEAPLVAICAALGGFVSRKIFKRHNRNIIRKHTLMGMAGALSAFFGTVLGGSLFALEVNSRFGVEYFEHVVESLFCGQVCLTVFRFLCGLPFGPIWDFGFEPMKESYPTDVMIGVVLGLLGAAIAAIFANFHWRVMDMFKALDLIDNSKAVQRALFGSIVVVILGVLIPHTMFWGEFEFQTICTMAKASDLAHIWPTKGLLGFEMDNGWHAFLVGISKLIAISFSVSGGYRGGFIFPFFATGAAFGRAFCAVFPQVNVSLACLCLAAGINVGITRTALGTSIILCYLGNEPYAITAVLVASIVSLFATSYMHFIKSQITRSTSVGDNLQDSIHRSISRLLPDDHQISSFPRPQSENGFYEANESDGLVV